MRTGFRYLIAATLFTTWALFTAGGCGDETTVIEQPPGSPGTVAPENSPTIINVKITELFAPNPIIVTQDVTTQVATLVIVNNVTINHIIIADDGSFNSGIIRPGETVTVPINQTGDHPFGCGLHPNDPNERGTVHVNPPNQASPTPTPPVSPTPTPIPIVLPTPTPVPSATPIPSATPSPVESPRNTVIINVGASNLTNNAFGTGPIQVDQGAEITIINNDTVDHTVTADNGSFDTGTINPGVTETLVINEPGTFAFHCAIHPNMKGVFNVQATPQPSPTP